MRERWLSLGGVVVVVTALFSGCELKKPGLPTWSVEATIPFSERVYRMGELLTDSQRLADRGWGFVVDPADGTMRFVARQEFLAQRVEDRLKYEASDTSRFTNTIDTIVVDETLPDADTIVVHEANPALFRGFSGPVLPFHLEPNQDTLIYQNIIWVDVVESYLRVEVTNHFPFPVDTLKLNFHNLVGGEYLGTIEMTSLLPPGGSWLDSLSLGGKRVEGSLLIEVTGYSTGSPTPITIAGDEVISIVVSISQSRVLGADAEIPRQSFSQYDTLLYDNPNRIVRAAIKEGKLYLQANNILPLEVQVHSTLINFKHDDGTPVSLSLQLSPETRGELEEVDLSGVTIEMDLYRQELILLNEVEVVDSRQTRYQGKTHQRVYYNQGVEVEYWTEDLVLSYLEGSLDSIRIDIPQLLTTLHLPQGLDSINFTRDTLFLHIENGTQMNLFLNFGIRASNSVTRRETSIPVVELVRPGLNTILIPDADRLVRVIPDTIQTVGWGGLGRKFLPGHPIMVEMISDSDYFRGEVELRSGLKFTLGNTTIRTDPIKLSQALDFPIEQVEVTTRLSNSIPLGATVWLMLGNDTLAMDTLLKIFIPRGEIGWRRVISAADTLITIMMDSVALRKMRQEPVYTRQMFALTPTQGDTVWIFPDDSLVVQASATIHYMINGE